MVEPLNWLALRVAYEYSQLSVSGIFAHGHGFMTGAKTVLGRWEINLNYVSRFRPYRIILGQGHTERIMLFGVSWNGLK